MRVVKIFIYYPEAEWSGKVDTGRATKPEKGGMGGVADMARCGHITL
jgi:hypothetical protein